MAASKKFKAWALSHTIHHPKTRLPYRISIAAHEDIVDFIHGLSIGLLLGFVIGFSVLRML